MSKVLKKLSLIMLATMLANVANAEYRVVGSESQIAEVPISRYEQNLIEIQDRKITSVIPSVNGSLAYQKDNENGVLYFTLANPNFLGTISVFVNDDEGERYKLILIPTEQAAQEIVIVPPTKVDDRKTVIQASELQEASGSYIYEIKNMMFSLARAGNGVNVDDEMSKMVINEKIPLWKEADFQITNRYDNGVLVGEEYYITNVTKRTLVLREQEFYRNNVLAVSIGKSNLEPNETTTVYVVRGRS